jgi:hypothetical protein
MNYFRDTGRVPNSGAKMLNEAGETVAIKFKIINKN